MSQFSNARYSHLLRSKLLKLKYIMPNYTYFEEYISKAPPPYVYGSHRVASNVITAVLARRPSTCYYRTGHLWAYAINLSYEMLANGLNMAFLAVMVSSNDSKCPTYCICIS